MGDRVEQRFRQITRGIDVRVNTRKLVDRHREYLGVLAGFVAHAQHTERPYANDGAGNYRNRGHHEHVHRIAVLGQGLGDITIVTGIVHRRSHETIDEHRAGFLVDLVFDRIAMRRDFYDDVHVIGHVLSAANPVENHDKYLDTKGRAL